MKFYLVTGFVHGSIVRAVSVRSARKLFKKAYNDEQIIHVKRTNRIY